MPDKHSAILQPYPSQSENVEACSYFPSTRQIARPLFLVDKPRLGKLPTIVGLETFTSDPIIDVHLNKAYASSILSREAFIKVEFINDDAATSPNPSFIITI